MASGYNKLGTQEAQNDMYVVLKTFHCNTEENKTPPIKARDYKDPLVVVMDRAAYNQGENAKYDFEARVGGGVTTSHRKRSGSGMLSEHSVQGITKE